MKVREAVFEDKESILKLWKYLMECHDEMDKDSKTLSSLTKRHKDADQLYLAFLDEKMADPNSWVLVAESEGVVGYLVAFVKETWQGLVNKRTIYVLDFAVDENVRGKGIGSALISALEKIARKHGVKYLELHVNPKNRDAVRFYGKKGFEERRKNMVKKVGK